MGTLGKTGGREWNGGFFPFCLLAVLFSIMSVMAHSPTLAVNFSSILLLVLPEPSLFIIVKDRNNPVHINSGMYKYFMVNPNATVQMNE